LNGIITVSNEEKNDDEMRIYKFKAGLGLIFFAILLIVGGCNELLYRLITSQNMSGLFFRFDVNYGLEMMGFHFNTILFVLVLGLTGLFYILPIIRENKPVTFHKIR